MMNIYHKDYTIKLFVGNRPKYGSVVCNAIVRCMT